MCYKIYNSFLWKKYKHNSKSICYLFFFLLRLYFNNSSLWKKYLSTQLPNEYYKDYYSSRKTGEEGTV